MPYYFILQYFVLTMIWFTLSRDASYTTQPLELLNDLGFDNSKHHKVFTRVSDATSGLNPSVSDGSNSSDNHHNNVYENGDTVGMMSPNANTDGNALDHN